MTGRRERSSDTGPPTNFPHDPLERVVGAYLLPVDVREDVVGERFGHAPLDEIGRRVHRGGAQVVDDRARFSVGRVPVLLGMDSLEHMAHLADFGRWNEAEYILVEMHHATLPASFGQVLGGALRQTTASIRNDQLHALEAARPGDAEKPTSRTCPPWRPRRCLESPEPACAVASSSSSL